MNKLSTLYEHKANIKHDVIKCPRPKVSANEKSRMFTLLDDGYLGRILRWTSRLWPMCPDPGLHRSTCHDKPVWVRL